MPTKKGHFYASVSEGEIHLDNKEVCKLFVKNFEGKRIEITIEEETDDWTTQQFRYLYSCVYTPLAAEVGYTVEELDGVLKRKFLTRNKGTKKEYVKEKSSLNRKELAEYIDKCIQQAAEVGVVCLPANKFWREGKND